MKGKLLVVLLSLVFCLSLGSQVKEAETSSIDLEKELRATLEILGNAWNEGDIDTIAEIVGDAIGYGCRTPAARLVFNKKGTKWFYDSMEIFEWTLKDDATIRIVDNVGLVLGGYIEKYKPKSGELKSVEGRTSMTFVRAEGKWKLTLYHRDIQFSK